MDTKIKEMLQELGDAINETVANSARIGAVMHLLRESGYEVDVVLEAKLTPEDISSEPVGDLFTEDDREFLRRLRIES